VPFNERRDRIAYCVSRSTTATAIGRTPVSSIRPTRTESGKSTCQRWEAAPFFAVFFVFFFYFFFFFFYFFFFFFFYYFFFLLLLFFFFLLFLFFFFV
jgi:hypothetical protein